MFLVFYFGLTQVAAFLSRNFYSQSKYARARYMRYSIGWFPDIFFEINNNLDRNLSKFSVLTILFQVFSEFLRVLPVKSTSPTD